VSPRDLAGGFLRQLGDDPHAGSLELGNQLLAEDQLEDRQVQLGGGRLFLAEGTHRFLLERHLAADRRPEPGELLETSLLEHLARRVPGGQDIGDELLGVAIPAFAKEGGDREHLAHQVVRERQRVHAAGEGHPARVGRRVRGVLQLQLVISVPADVGDHQQQQRQHDYHEQRGDAD